MQILKSLILAFSIYSQIPMPQFEWKEEDMKYTFCFFPWIGAVIGGCVYFWDYLCERYFIGSFCRSAVGIAIPLFLTGGFHADGFMDTMDAFHSYQPKERKLEILKDSHIGAFSVLMLLLYGCIYVGAFSEVREEGLVRIVCGGFFLSRCLSGISAVSFPLAKKGGMLFQFVDKSHKRIVLCTLYLQSVCCIGFFLWCSFVAGLFITAGVFFFFAYYGWRVKKEFGGITGDTAGYFVLVCEGCIVVGAAVGHILGI